MSTPTTSPGAADPAADRGRRTTVAEVAVGPAARVYAEGWQSWSPTTWYRSGDPAHRPEQEWQHLMRFRPGAPLPAHGLQAEGLVVVDPGDGAPATVVGAHSAEQDVPTLRATWREGVVEVSTDGAVDVRTELPATALTGFGDRFGAAAGARTSAAAPRVWCTWYRYFEDVTAADVLEGVRALDEHDLPVDVVQVDDGWSTGTGEWTRPRPGFGSLPDVVAAVRDSGRRAGIWLAPFTVGAQTDLARRHPDWLTGPAGSNWGQQQLGLDPTHPGVRAYLTDVVAGLRDLGVDYFKLDFLYAGALPGHRHEDSTAVAAYRSGLQLLREAAGEDAYLVGCGAPLMPSVGLVDAMRVSPDVFHEGGEDGSQGLRGRMSAQARAWQHGRWWTTDPDCLVVRPSYALREQCAELVLGSPGLRAFSDRVAELDEWGLAAVRRLLGAAA